MQNTLPTFLLLFATLFSFKGIAQTDSTSDSREGEFNIDYLSPTEYVFMYHEETPWMFKLGYSGPSVAFERKIIDGFTLNLEVGNDGSRSGRYGSLSLRYYYNMLARNKARTTPFNLSGNYLAIGFSSNATSNRNFNSYSIKWGAQRRYLKHGYFDLGLVASYRKYSNNESYLRLHTEAQIGFVLARDKSSFDKNKLCVSVKCQEFIRSTFKLNLAQLIDVFHNSDYTALTLSPEIEYEVKYGKSPLSLNTSLQPTLSLYLLDRPSGNLSDIFEADLLVENRYYFNLNRRILKGKAGNGMSAEYVATGILNNGFLTEINLGAVYGNEKVGLRLLQPQLTIGSQRFIGDSFYYNINGGFRWSNFFNNNYDYKDRYDYEFFISTKVGLRF